MFIFKYSLEGELCGETLWQTSHLNCRKCLLFGLEVRLNQHEGPEFAEAEGICVPQTQNERYALAQMV